MDISTETLLKFYGPLGLIIAILLLTIWKWLIPRMDKRDEEYRAAINSALDDARKERDAMRLLREKEVDKFLDSLRYRDQEFRSIAEAIAERRQTRR